ncbi:ferritin-like domain-containing protein [Hymenobacter sp. BT188]|uniref:ferritin-like domain-containing protein n=1 Tax=Hymenobacter sp. BT188 TaxID=2763504 RepID=UPI0016517FB7|nr:ferritin-like domain-containing protein [Hymenobacter sp. BT188]MBC6606416.1 ferritin-like domain-containing protein [Hymenobacter sp. BT188]
MNILKLLADLAEVDPTLYDRLSSRRAAFAPLSQLGRKAALAALPLALGTAIMPAQARDIRTILDSLNLALILEYLESEFYARALGLVAGAPSVPAGFFPAGTRPAIETIYRHEQQHVRFMERVIQASGGTLPTKPRFDFTGSKNGAQPAVFADVFTNFDTFLQVAQTLEDAGVRAYKGQVGFLQTDNSLLEAALRIHSVEARHASHIRSMRRARGANVKNWVSASDTSIAVPGKTDAVYASEDLVNQFMAGLRQVPFDQAPLNTVVAVAKVAEAFDEPIPASTATSLVSIFTY